METIHDLHNHTVNKDLIGLLIMSIKPTYLQLSDRIESVVMDLNGIFHVSDCILG